MKLLILTQAVDTQDSVLGFFCGWLKEFSKHYDSIEVVCLKEGEHKLPTNVHIHSLGKESGRSRIKYIFRFYRYLWSLRREYDAVFVHMNQEYVLLGGIPWRLLRKRIGFWRNYRTGTLLTSPACWLAHHVFYTSPDSYTARFKHAVRMPMGIDTRTFTLGKPIPRSILFLGRLDPEKRTEIFVEALSRLHEAGTLFTADIYGDPTYGESPYIRALKEQAMPLIQAGVLKMHPAIPNPETPPIFAAHALYVNITPAGSFDKTIGEAMASGSLVVCMNDAVSGVLPGELIINGSTESLIEGIEVALGMDQQMQDTLRMICRSYVEDVHSLELLARRLRSTFDV